MSARLEETFYISMSPAAKSARAYVYPYLSDVASNT
jgi:hypothetical protein